MPGNDVVAIRSKAEVAVNKNFSMIEKKDTQPPEIVMPPITCSGR